MSLSHLLYFTLFFTFKLVYVPMFLNYFIMYQSTGKNLLELTSVLFTAYRNALILILKTLPKSNSITNDFEFRANGNHLFVFKDLTSFSSCNCVENNKIPIFGI
jgi:hypothetical protein